MNTMCRLGEVLALTWNDFDGTSLSINKSMNKDENALNTTKTKKVRTLFLSDELIKILNDYKQKEMQKPGFKEDWFIFNCWDGKKYHDGYKALPRNNVTRRKYDACELLGVRRIRIHDQRHSVATNVISKGADIKAVSEYSGHSDVRTTQEVYRHLLGKDKAKVIEVTTDFTKFYHKK